MTQAERALREHRSPASGPLESLHRHEGERSSVWVSIVTSGEELHQPLLTFVRDELYSLISRNGEFMNDGIVVTALDARTNFGKLLRRVEDEGRSLVIEKRGSPRAVLLSIRDYVRLAVPEPEVLRIIGRESKKKGTSRLSAKQIDQVVKTARKSKSR